MKKMFIFAAACAAFASCVKENPANNPSGENIVTIQAGASNTKTQLVDGYDVQWSPEDVILACFEPEYYVSHNSSTRYGYTSQFTNHGEILSESACFQGTWSPYNQSKLNKTGIAIYPGNSDRFSWSSDNYYERIPTTTVSYTIPTEQEAIEGTFAKDINISWATLDRDEVANNKAKNVIFNNLCSIFCISLPDTDYNIKSIKLEMGNNSNTTYMTGKSLLTYTNGSISESKGQNLGVNKETYVILRKSDGSNLIPGEKYYAVVWPHYYKGIKLTIENAEGKEATKTAAPEEWIECLPGKCYNFNISSLTFTAEPYLNVDITSITTIAKGGNLVESFFVYANNAVTVSSDVNWLSASYSNGQCYISTTPNNTSGQRKATLTFTSQGLTKTVEVYQPCITYKVTTGTAVDNAENLKHGALYIIANKYTNTYITTESGQASFESHSTSDTFYGKHVFEYIQDLSKVQTFDSNYKSNSAGTLRSLARDMYLSNEAKFDVYSNNAQYLSIANRWKNPKYPYTQDPAGDMDVYYAGTENSLWYSGGTLKFGNASFGNNVNYRKWIFYEVTAQ